MREIKFRAWDPSLKQMSYYQKFGAFNGLFVLEADWIPLQYTGLKDKNGAEIYEGDIVRRPVFAWGEELDVAVGKIIYKEQSAAFCWRNALDLSLTMKEQDKYEIIGNIYENPELLTK